MLAAVGPYTSLDPDVAKYAAFGMGGICLCIAAYCFYKVIKLSIRIRKLERMDPMDYTTRFEKGYNPPPVEKVERPTPTPTLTPLPCIDGSHWKTPRRWKKGSNDGSFSRISTS